MAGLDSPEITLTRLSFLRLRFQRSDIRPNRRAMKLAMLNPCGPCFSRLKSSFTLRHMREKGVENCCLQVRNGKGRIGETLKNGRFQFSEREKRESVSYFVIVLPLNTEGNILEKGFPATFPNGGDV